ncbi:MAG TPA: GNAT family N-acetyltransferase [Thermomicrobiales bacterium]|jgi:GNAT superfamily N-acetyltransferase
MTADSRATDPTERALQIRPAIAADADFISGFVARFAESGALPWRDPALMATFHASGVAQVVAHARAPEEGHQVLVATAGDGQPLGFIYLHNQRSGLTGEEQGYVSMLSVTREAEGRGVARALLAAAEDWAREQGFRHLALDTFGDNLRARAVYAHLGFAEESLKLVKAL